MHCWFLEIAARLYAYLLKPIRRSRRLTLMTNATYRQCVFWQDCFLPYGNLPYGKCCTVGTLDRMNSTTAVWQLRVMARTAPAHGQAHSHQQGSQHMHLAWSTLRGAPFVDTQPIHCLSRYSHGIVGQARTHCLPNLCQSCSTRNLYNL